MQSNRILVSVIVPSFNRSETVGETIESILAQKVDADIEIVIGDDCSTDQNVKPILEKYRAEHPDIIRVFYREQNMQLGGNWAQCVKDCRGAFICNCDNDDYWHNPNKLQLQLDYYHSHPKCNILITDHRTHNRSTGEIKECKAIINRDVDIQRAMWGGSNFCNATIMYRASFMKEHLDLDAFISRRLSLQDWPAWVVLTAYTDVDILPVSTATFGVETVSLTRPDSVEKLAQRYKGDKEVYRYLGELFPNKFPYDEQGWNSFVVGRLLCKSFDVGDFQSALCYSRQQPTGVSKTKLFCAKHKWTFDMFRFLRKIFRRFGKR